MKNYLKNLSNILRPTFAPRRKSSQQITQGKRLAYEPLEPRIALSAAGLVDVGAQPEGSLSGKIVYTHGGHGFTGDYPSAGQWSTQRGLGHGMIEDLGNQDQMSFFANYLFQAGATVVPLRPVGHQSNEVILDNDDVGVTFTGAWSNSSSNVYFGDAGDVPYRFASTSATETATANYRPNIPEAGFYPVYAWTRSGSDRAADQLYRVNHSGGSTEVKVNHRRVGNGLVYLGTYHFDAGTEGSVDISNRSSESGRVVIADMIRFGNGVGDITASGNVSGRDREDEAGLYWVEWHVDHSQGIPTSSYRSSSNDRNATVSLAPRYSEFMNREADGDLSDRVFVSFHSNAGSGSNRGVLALYNGNNRASAATPNMFLLANTLGREVNDDLVAQNGQFEYDWYNRGSVVTLDRSDIEFGEINNEYIHNEFDATIVETAFHDNVEDAALMRDPKVRDAIARATYQGVVKYFHTVDSGATPLLMLPGHVEQVSAESTGVGSVKVSWTPPAVSDAAGDAPAGYRIYGSTDGYGFDGGTYVAGGSTTSYTFNGLDPQEGAYYFKVVAVNAGGEGHASEVVATLPNGPGKNILIVNGFDRLDRAMDPVQAGADRARPRQSNSYDYSVQVASAIEANTAGLAVDTTSNEYVISGDVSLGDYDTVVWILGEESTNNKTFSATEQSLVASYLSNGGQLFLSGSEVGWDLDAQNNGQSFYNNSLKSDYVADNANTYQVAGATGSIFDGLSFSFDDGSQFYDVDYPDVIAPRGGATAAMQYVGGTGGAAAIQYDSGAATKLVSLAFPFETITSEEMRNSVFARVLEFFDYDVVQPDVELVLDNDDGPTVYSEIGNWTTSTSPGFNGGTYRFAVAGDSATSQWNFTLPYAGQAEVSVYYVTGSNRSDNTVYKIDTGNGIEEVAINQKTGGSAWVSLGTFDVTAGAHTVVLDAEASSGGSVIIADAVRVFLSASVEESADFNNDGAADGFDFLTWQQNSGAAVGASREQGDANGDGAVDSDDLAIWHAQYGMLESGSPTLAAAQGSESSADSTKLRLETPASMSDAYAVAQAVGLQSQTAPELPVSNLFDVVADSNHSTSAVQRSSRYSNEANAGAELQQLPSAAEQRLIELHRSRHRNLQSASSWDAAFDDLAESSLNRHFDF